MGNISSVMHLHIMEIDGQVVAVVVVVAYYGNSVADISVNVEKFFPL